jgi:hypothetical protein
LLLIATLASSIALTQDLSLQASVDRAVVQENESFTYLLRVQGSTRAEPDLTPLAASFDILQRSRNTSIQMTGGRTLQTTEWTLQLMPREAGSFTLPPVSVAGVSSNALNIEVVPAAVTSAAADIFIEVAAEPNDPYVQSQVVYTMTLYRGVGTGRSSLTLPEVSGGEAIIEKLGQDREFQTVLDGRSFIALERQYAIFPQASGTITIDPVIFEAMVVSNSGFSNVQRYRSEPLTLSVQSSVPPPAEFAAAAWIPAQALRLEERWSAGGGELTAGIPQTRTLSIIADGVLETQLPDLSIPQSDNIRLYSDQPELGRESDQGTTRAHRTERFAVLAQSAGTHVLEKVELPWFNVSERRWEVAEIPAKTFDVLPGAVAINPDPGEEIVLAEDPIVQSNDRIWQGISAALLAIWLITLGLWYSSRRSDEPQIETAEPLPSKRSSSRRLLKQIRGACDANDAGRARELLLAWGELRIPDASAQSLGELAESLPSDLATAANELERCLYGPKASSWNGAELRAALANVDTVSSPSRPGSADELLPLYR